MLWARSAGLHGEEGSLGVRIVGDCREVLPTLEKGSVQCCVTSPPYFGLRDYGTATWEGGDEGCDHSDRFSTTRGGPNCRKCGAWRIDSQIGLEGTIEEYIATMVGVFRLVWDVLADDGVVFLNMGDSYWNGASVARPDVPSCDNGSIEQSGYQEIDCAYRDLCDVCLADFLTHRDRNAGIAQPAVLAARPVLPTSRDIRNSDSFSEVPGASLLCDQASTILESWRQSRGACSHCANRAVLSRRLQDSYVDGVQASEHNSACSDGIIPKSFSSAGHKGIGRNDGPLGYYTIPSRLKPKDLCGIPWRLALALQTDGWYLRSDIIWSKSNPMPESVTDRPTKAHEYLFLLSKRASYYYDADAVREPHAEPWRGKGEKDAWVTTSGIRQSMGRASDTLSGWGKREYNPAGRNKRTVWKIASQAFKGSHFATFPEKLVEPCILAGTSERGHCPGCGGRWERVQKDTPEYSRFKADEKLRKGGGMRSSKLETMGLTRGRSNKSINRTSITLGWAPTCDCGLDPVPDIVLDPFFGSGTVGMVAAEHGRGWIGIELNPEYSALARETAPVSLRLAL